MEGYAGFYIDNEGLDEEWKADSGLYTSSCSGTGYGSGTGYYNTLSTSTGDGFSCFSEIDESLFSPDSQSGCSILLMRWR